MLPPVPPSRQSSYSYTVPRRASTSHRPPSIDSDNEEDEETMIMDDMEGGDVGDDGSQGSDRRDMGAEHGERGLEDTLERLGMGRYHWRLLALCGFGWMSDNSALQCVAVILPRVQIHYDLSNQTVGFLSASTMAGMMVGSIAWGVLSDLLGRALPFHSTLFMTAVFGIAASFAPSFPVLCCAMFLLGTAVGGSMPTDGTLFLENLPGSKQYLLTLLSVFFSLGAVISSLVAAAVLPGASCRSVDGCDVAGGANDGWRRMMLYLGLINMACAGARLCLFRLHESPRYLVTNGREHEAVTVLQAIADFNAHDMAISHADVLETKFDAAEHGVNDELLPRRSAEHASLPSNVGSPVYDSFGQGPAPQTPKPIRLGDSFYTPVGEQRADDSYFRPDPRSTSPLARTHDQASRQAGHGLRPSRHKRTLSHASPTLEEAGGWLRAWQVQLGKLFVPKWRRTVILMWIIWASMSFAYTMFNVWLPAVLETRAGDGDEAIGQALHDFVLYSVAGTPGSILGAWMIQTRLGRRKSLAICTAVTAASTFIFIRVKADWAVIVSSMTISAAATAMYAVLYGMTPETFGTSIRGTACGTSAALSRLTGVCAPVSAGVLMTLSPSLPVFVSAGIFAVTAGCALLLPFERAGGQSGKGGGMVH